MATNNVCFRKMKIFSQFGFFLRCFIVSVLLFRTWNLKILKNLEIQYLETPVVAKTKKTDR